MQAKDVTPYMLALYAHVPEVLKLYQNLAYYMHSAGYGEVQ